MNALIIFLLAIPAVEIYLMIKIGGMFGAFNTILLIFFTAVVGVFFARLEGLNTLRSGLSQLIKNQVPIYEIISGAALAFAALLLILPGFLTDVLGFLLIIPPTRKIFILSLSSKFKKNKVNKEAKIHNEFIEGDIEEPDQDQK